MSPSEPRARAARRRLAVAFAIGLVACGPDPVAARAADPRPDVVVVVLDTLRPDHLGLYGHARDPAPYLSELGARSAVFDNAFSTSSKTTPATASLFTGVHPTRHAVLRGVEVARKKIERLLQTGEASVRVRTLPSELETLPEVFQRAGYRTFGLVANTQVSEQMGFARGFDRFTCLDWTAVEDTLPVLAEWEAEIAAAPVPTFLYLHLIDPHHPYNAREPWYLPQGDELEETRARYESEIHHVDGALAELHERMGWDADTLIVVVSDHGEELKDHGRYGHRFSLYDELNRVLFLVHDPATAEGRRLAQNVSLVDVLPTVAELAGVPAPGDRAGRSLAGLVRDSDGEPSPELLERPVFAHRATLEETDHLWSVVLGPWKLMQLNGDTPFLYHLVDDRGEREDRAADEPERVARMLELLDSYRAGAFPEGGDYVEIALDEEMVENLGELGYVEDE